jgi:hypothetical protein
MLSQRLGLLLARGHVWVHWACCSWLLMVAWVQEPAR